MVSMTDEVPDFAELADGLTVGAVAEVAAVTVRTLHHWDQLGLVVPSGRTTSGYRLYTQHDLDRIDRVLAYREAGVDLETIRALLDDPSVKITAALRDQRTRIAERIDELSALDDRLRRLSEAQERGIMLTEDEQRDTFGANWDPERSQAAGDLWGGTAQWAQFAERSAARSQADWQQLADAMGEVQDEIVDAVERGVTDGSAEANAIVAHHRRVFSQLFTLTPQMQVCLARMFEADPGFAAHYNGLAPGAASWFRRSVDAAARAGGIDPDTATWQ